MSGLNLDLSSNSKFCIEFKKARLHYSFTCLLGQLLYSSSFRPDSNQPQQQRRPSSALAFTRPTCIPRPISPLRPSSARPPPSAADVRDPPVIFHLRPLFTRTPPKPPAESLATSRTRQFLHFPHVPRRSTSLAPASASAAPIRCSPGVINTPSRRAFPPHQAPVSLSQSRRRFSTPIAPSSSFAWPQHRRISARR